MFSNAFILVAPGHARATLEVLEGLSSGFVDVYLKNPWSSFISYCETRSSLGRQNFGKI